MTKDFKDYTAQDWQDHADRLAEASAAAYKRKEESWERSDTDGFLSQWASGLTGQLEKTREGIARAGGVADFKGLYDGDRRLRAKQVTFADRHAGYGTKTMWLLDEPETEKYGRKWIPIGDRSRVQKSLSLVERWELAPAWAKMDGRGTGLSGSAWVATYRRGDEWGQDSQLMEDNDAEI